LRCARLPWWLRPMWSSQKLTATSYGRGPDSRPGPAVTRPLVMSRLSLFISENSMLFSILLASLVPLGARLTRSRTRLPPISILQRFCRSTVGRRPVRLHRLVRPGFPIVASSRQLSQEYSHPSRRFGAIRRPPRTPHRCATTHCCLGHPGSLPLVSWIRTSRRPRS